MGWTELSAVGAVDTDDDGEWARPSLVLRHTCAADEYVPAFDDFEYALATHCRRESARRLTRNEAIRRDLSSIEGIDGVFVAVTADETVVYVVAREHGVVDMEKLLEAEKRLCED